MARQRRKSAKENGKGETPDGTHDEPKLAGLASRIVELRQVPVAELRSHPLQWRRHSPAQRGALLGLLERVGWVGAARPSPSAF